ncbi:hypothetical protein F2Q70_00004992 [Brassica cretica]|uniref:Uncharacterized protein n=1 Tax=Brassica cretica TaxID=69181 RepID=A0A3N6R8W1_BRACR|nr:hypothetical protein F2Q70_00004992 [Brassica cretica]
MFMGKKYLVFAGYTKIRLHGRDCNEGKVIYHGSGFLLESSTFSTSWDEIARLITNQSMEKKKRFCLRYAFQVTL